MTETLAVNTDRNFKVQVTPCVVTKQFDRCIVVSLGTVPVRIDDGDVRYIQVEGAFSRAGLQSLMTDLESVPDPIGLPVQSDIDAATPYQWAVVMEDGEHYQQYPGDSTEKPFSEIHLPNVKQFWLIPKTDPNAVPWYGLIRGEGFVKGSPTGYEPLNLPHPGAEPFWWQYYRKHTLTFALGCGQAHQVPPHVVQILGWRVGETIFEIGVEPDGHYQVWRRQPLDDPRWANG